MNPTDIPPDVRSFVEAHVPTVGHMEALALAFEEPVDWTCAGLAARLFITESQMRRILDDFLSSGLLQGDQEAARWQTDAVSVTTAALVERTLRLYRQRLVPMTQLIHARGDAGRQLSRAFSFRKD